MIIKTDSYQDDELTIRNNGDDKKVLELEIIPNCNNKYISFKVKPKNPATEIIIKDGEVIFRVESH